MGSGTGGPAQRSIGGAPARATAPAGDVAAPPLSGVRVVELANVISGPFAGKLLVDLGATVIKVEQPGGGDPFRHWDSVSEASSPSFNSLNRGKQSVTLDLKDPTSQQVLRSLIATADVMTENFRPGFLARHGLGFEDCLRANPQLVYCSVRGLGYDDDRPVYDAIAQAKSGLWSQFTDLSDPEPVGPALADYLTGLHACLAVVAALAKRATSPGGQHLEVTMLGSCLSVEANAVATYLADGRVADSRSRPRTSQSYAFLAGDGLPFAIHLSSVPKFWENLTSVVGRPDLRTDERFARKPDRVRNYDGLREELSPIFRQRPRIEWLDLLRRADVPAAPIFDVAQALADPDVQSLDVLRPFGSGDREFVGLGLPVRCAAWRSGEPGLPVPKPGEHTQEVLGGIASKAAAGDIVSPSGDGPRPEEA